MVAPAPAHSGLPFAIRFARAHPKEFLHVAVGRSVPFAREDLVSDELPAAAAAEVM